MSFDSSSDSTVSTDSSVSSVFEPDPNLLNRFDVVMDQVRNIETKYVRKILSLMQVNEQITPHHFIPNINMTVGEFCTAYVIRNKEKRQRNKR